VKKFNQSRVNGGSNYDSLKVQAELIMSTAKRNSAPRRTSGAIRAEHMQEGAVLLKIDFEGRQFNPVGMAVGDFTNRTDTFGLKGKSISGEEAIKNYETMERKGFKVTKDLGCLIPTSHYCTHQAGDAFKGYQKTFFRAHGFLPKPLIGEVPRDDSGRDMSPQLSHLCHRRWCCRIDHVTYEYKWRNFVRNGCLGPTVLNSKASCGCSLQYDIFGLEKHGPSCLRAFTPSAPTYPGGLPLCDSAEEVTEVLQATGFPYNFAFVDYLKRELGQAKRQDRKRSKSALPPISEVSPVAKKRRSLGKETIVLPAQDIVFDADPRKVVVFDNDSDFEIIGEDADAF